MKRFFYVIIAFAMILSLCACGSSGKTETTSPDVSTSVDELDPSVSSDNGATATPDSETDQSSTATDSPEENADVANEFVPNDDLRIVAAFSYDNDTHVVIENVGDQAILNYRVAYIAFDKNGFVATRDSRGYDTGKHETVNLMPSEKAISTWYGADGVYTVAVIVGVDYQDGSTWEAQYIEKWASTVRSEFNVDAYKSEIDKLKEFDALATTNEYAMLTDHSIQHRNQFSSKHDFLFSISNTSDQGITKLSLFILEFDENGFPVSVNPYDTYCINGHSTGGTLNLAAGQSGSYTNNLFISPTTTQIKVVISSIEFQDGTDWQNPYIYEWILANNGIF